MTTCCPYFKRAENDEARRSEFLGVGGPLNVAPLREPRPLTERLLAAAQETGIPFNPDVNSPEQDGVSTTPVMQRNGRRWSNADAYLRPAMRRPNLTVKTGVQVLGLAIEGDRVSGVRLRDRRGRDATARARRETILSAGAIGSPQLLLLSGIGPARHLREVGVEPRSTCPGSARTSRTTLSSCSASSPPRRRASPTRRSPPRCCGSCCAAPGR